MNYGDCLLILYYARKIEQALFSYSIWIMNATDFLHFIISSLVANKDMIEITEKQDELGTLLTLRVDPVDMGSIIGKWWKTIDSIRTVLRVFGSKAGIRLNLRILEDQKV